MAQGGNAYMSQENHRRICDNRNVPSVPDSPSFRIMRSVRKAFLRIRQQFVTRNGLQKPPTCASAILM